MLTNNTLTKLWNPFLREANICWLPRSPLHGRSLLDNLAAPVGGAQRWEELCTPLQAEDTLDAATRPHLAENTSLEEAENTLLEEAENTPLEEA